jgi:hypothetical protein
MPINSYQARAGSVGTARRDLHRRTGLRAAGRLTFLDTTQCIWVLRSRQSVENGMATLDCCRRSLDQSIKGLHIDGCWNINLFIACCHRRSLPSRQRANQVKKCVISNINECSGATRFSER